jgi:phosphoribosyl 1,2-cyclic phosphate phosphodiesterase
MKITFLGTGTSHGVPSIDCMLSSGRFCRKDVCGLALTDAKHSRTRSSILVEFCDKRVLVDVSSDFRMQALRERIPAIDAVLITHCHADHIGGIPDIRSYTAQRPEPLAFFGSEESMNAVRRSFPYIFDPGAFLGGGIPKIATNAVSAPFTLFGKRVLPLRVDHGNLAGCFGYRIDAMAYIPDMKSLGPQVRDSLGNLDVLILNCLRETNEHSSHLVLEQSMRLAREIGPKRCFFIHMSHDIHYQADAAKIDGNMEFSYDGLKIEI